MVPIAFVNLKRTLKRPISLSQIGPGRGNVQTLLSGHCRGLRVFSHSTSKRFISVYHLELISMCFRYVRVSPRSYGTVIMCHHMSQQGLFVWWFTFLLPRVTFCNNHRHILTFHRTTIRARNLCNLLLRQRQ